MFKNSLIFLPAISNSSANLLLILYSVFLNLNIVFPVYNFHLCIFIILLFPNYLKILLYIFVHSCDIYSIFKFLFNFILSHYCVCFY